MSDVARIIAGLTVACGSLAALGPTAHGQPLRAVQWVGPALGQIPAGTGELAIGDPWWDEAEAEGPVADPDDALVEADVEVDDDADPRVRMQAQLRAHAEMLRQQFEQEGLAILRRELSIVRQTCPSLERQQRALVLQAGRQAIVRLVNDQLDTAIGRRRGRQADMNAAIGDALRAAVTANAAAEESAAYAAERGLRQERVRRATIAAIVADVDRDAFLDDGEREALAEALAEAYRERWRPAVVALQQGIDGNGGGLLPGVERCVEKAIGRERKAEWLAWREEARRLVAEAGGRQIRMPGDGGMMQIEVQAEAVAGGGVVRRVIRRRVDANGDGGRVQVEVQIGGAAEATAAVEEALEEQVEEDDDALQAD